VTTPAQSSEAPGPAASIAGAATALHANDDFDRNVWCVLGIPIDIATVAAAASLIERGVRDRRRLVIATPNVNWLVRALRNEEARRELLDADLSLADGAPVAALARLLGAPVEGRTAGSDVFEALRARSGVRGRRIRVFFFGGRDGTAEAAASALAHDKSGLEAAGFLNPGHGDVASMSSPAIIEEINAARPDFLVVALGAAKGQAWIQRNKEKLNAPAISHLGAVVDFTAGSKARAPLWMQRSGLEWLWRIYAEPALWRRYAGDAAGMMGLLVARVLPQLALGPSGCREGKAGAALAHEDGATVIKLSGPLAGDLSAVRQSFREAARARGDLIVDLAAATALDRAFLGLVLMLEKHALRRGARVSIRGASRAQRALFKANAMNYPTAMAQSPAAENYVARASAS
jgi:N-acetylglucosaminyldiphosphoundecaprenol N-acetyl-beta-D-mannosaminyltransferase